jgi:hypothetical protein
MALGVKREWKKRNDGCKDYPATQKRRTCMRLMMSYKTRVILSNRGETHLQWASVQGFEGTIGFFFRPAQQAVDLLSRAGISYRLDVVYGRVTDG